MSPTAVAVTEHFIRSLPRRQPDDFTRWSGFSIPINCPVSADLRLRGGRAARCGHRRSHQQKAKFHLVWLPEPAFAGCNWYHHRFCPIFAFQTSLDSPAGRAMIAVSLRELATDYKGRPCVFRDASHPWVATGAPPYAVDASTLSRKLRQLRYSLRSPRQRHARIRRQLRRDRSNNPAMRECCS